MLSMVIALAERELITTIIKAGDDKNFPKKGQKVTVHYTGTLLNGKKFDSSKDRNQPFVFQLGVGQVIKGWDLAVAKMSVGQVVSVTIPYELAYGERGMPPTIPAKSDLIFEIELIKFD
ncbi:Peptidylprolyl_isomerase [Hexamita inflata]|uniref:peptidylprolyl isomerase n=1 Tax=Hexamita inflata TaxID=28002 RepID=A0AA86N8X5_9EUKA|nr:Peptidylprolyl isomerase [Hexamita inflata]